MSETFSSTSSSTPSPTCIVEDQSTRIAEDGSQFMLLCRQSFVVSELVGVDSSSVSDFESCLELCAEQGTPCAGFTYEALGGQCRLQSQMKPSDTTADGLVSVVRMGGPNGATGRFSPVQNGMFDNTLDPWFSTTSNTGQRFAFNNNAARALLEIGSAPPDRPRLRARQSSPQPDSLTFQQDFSQPISGGYAYYLSFDLGFDLVSPGQDECQIYMQNGIGDIYTNLIVDVTNGMNQIYGSGSFVGSVPRILFSVGCSGSSDLYITLDNIIFDLYPTSRPNTVCDSNRQVVENSNFDSGLVSWNFSQGLSTSASFSVFSNRARITFDPSRSSQDDPAVVSQALAIPSGTNFTSYVDVSYTIPPLGSCSFDIRTDVESIYFSGQIFQNGWQPYTTSGTFETDVQAFVLRVDCYPGGTSVDFDNVYLYLNPGPDCPPPSQDHPPDGTPP